MEAASSEFAGRQSLSHAGRFALCHLPVDPCEDLAASMAVLHGFSARAGTQLSSLAKASIHPIAWSPAGVSARLRVRLDAQAAPDLLDDALAVELHGPDEDLAAR
jgi:hypothetical protein